MSTFREFLNEANTINEDVTIYDVSNTQSKKKYLIDVGEEINFVLFHEHMSYDVIIQAQDSDNVVRLLTPKEAKNKDLAKCISEILPKLNRRTRDLEIFFNDDRSTSKFKAAYNNLLKGLTKHGLNSKLGHGIIVSFPRG